MIKLKQLHIHTEPIIWIMGKRQREIWLKILEIFLGTTKNSCPAKDASRYVLLYQYQYPASSFSARVCYDKNRDENGDGRIDKEEMKWYFPASNQMIGMYIGSF